MSCVIVEGDTEPRFLLQAVRLSRQFRAPEARPLTYKRSAKRAALAAVDCTQRSAATVAG
jgi:hypothetical protein